jgi:hypothetical protein
MALTYLLGVQGFKTEWTLESDDEVINDIIDLLSCEMGATRDSNDILEHRFVSLPINIYFNVSRSPMFMSMPS